jgi:hypothetical protein
LSEPAFDELLRRLAEADIEFVVVGSLAVNAWGVVRGTKDVDVVVAPDIENLERIAEVAVASGGHVQQEEALLGRAISIASALASGEQVAIETRPWLKAMKQSAGRTRDLADLEDLDAAGSWPLSSRSATAIGETGPGSLVKAISLTSISPRYHVPRSAGSAARIASATSRISPPWTLPSVLIIADLEGRSGARFLSLASGQ